MDSLSHLVLTEIFGNYINIYYLYDKYNESRGLTRGFYVVGALTSLSPRVNILELEEAFTIEFSNYI